MRKLDAFLTTAIGMSLAASSVVAATGRIIPPPLRPAQAAYYKAHPDEWKALQAQLPRVRTVAVRAASAPKPSPMPNTWTQTTNAPPGSGLSNPLLLTDGTVIIHSLCSPIWYKLTPDAHGDYVNGTWSSIHDMPFGNLYFASEILNDGRVVVNGGEYNSSCNADWGTNGAIYNPLSNAWTNLPPPSGWGNIGDAQSVILANTHYMLANCCSTQEAILNASTLAWTTTGTNKADENDEEGWLLLHNGKVLTTDAYVNTGTCGKNSELYTPSTGTWASAGDTPTELSDCNASGNQSYEVGPLVGRPAGGAVAFSGVTTGVAHTALYNPTTSSWSAGPDLPTIGGQNYNLADAPAVAMPSGAIMFAASPGLFSNPAHFFLFNAANAIVQLPDTPNASGLSAYVVNFLMLPTGQVLETDFSNDVEIYTPGPNVIASSKPTITSVPTTLTRGAAFSISGAQLNGVTHGVYGDDQQAATNFPLVRLTSVATGGVKWARTYGFSSRGIAPGLASSANFTMPKASVMAAGSYRLQVVANGITSDPVTVTVN